MKGMRKMVCVKYLGDEEVEIARYWLRKAGRVIDQIPVLKELRVDCVTICYQRVSLLVEDY
jgi:hypothetical protein